MLTKGQLVISKCGRDKNLFFIVISVDEEHAYLVDGQLRKIHKPKKKKFKHIQPTKYMDKHIQYKICNKQNIMDSDIRKALTYYKETFLAYQ